MILPFLYSMVLTGCMMVKGAGPSPRYFRLSACTETAPAEDMVQPEKAFPLTTEKEEGKVPVIIGPVQIPAYLDRPQIVRGARGNRLDISELNRWAEPLSEAIERVVAMDISKAAQGEFVVRPFSLDTPLERGSSGLRVLINCYSFEENPDGTVVLDAEWLISSVSRNRSLQAERLYLAAPVRGGDMKGTVGAMNDALHQLSEAILKDLRTVDLKR